MSQRPISQVTVAELSERAGLTRATFYNRYSTPLELLIQVLCADLERGHRLEETRESEGYAAAELLRMTTAEVGDHAERFREIYRLSLTDPADSGVYDALVRHFNDCDLGFMARSSGPEIPDVSRRVIAQFMAHGFACAIEAWLNDPSVAKGDMVDAGRGLRSAWVVWTARSAA
ncbi:TetR/AcrR family transcriptional regulator [Streptomyces avermitilis]